MPKRKAGWIPALTHLKRTARGRVRIPGKGDTYLGPPGCWPAGQDDPPDDVRRAYDAAVADWLSRRSAAPAGQPPGRSVSVNELLLAYLRYAESYYTKGGRPTTEVGLLRQATRLLCQRHGAESADSLTPARLRSLQSAFAEAGFVRRTVNAFVSRIRRVYAWGVERGMVRPDVWHGLLAVRGLPKGRKQAAEREPVKPVPDAWVERTAAQIPGQAAVALRLQLLTGMRPMEVCALRVSLLDTSAPTWVFRPDEAGNKLAHLGRDKAVFFGPKARALLKPLLKEAGKAGRDYVFVGVSGRPLRVRRYAGMVRDGAEAAGLPRWSPNRVRHNALTAARERYGLEGAQAVGGHAEIRTTQIYAERSEELARRIAEEMG